MAGATLRLQGIPGAACVPRNDLPPDDHYEYRGRSLTNTGTDGWDYLVAVCPVSEFVPQANFEEFRVFLTTEEEIWCQAFDPSGELVFDDYTTGGALGIWPRLPGWGAGMVELTLHCLLPPGASIDRLEILWNLP